MSTFIDYIVKLNTAKFITGLKKMRTGLKGLSTSVHRMDAQLTGFGGHIAAAIIVGLGAKMIKLGSDFEETNSKFQTVFKDVTKESEKTAKNLEKNFGLSSLASKTLLSDTGDLLTGFGFTGKMALNLSDEVQKLAVDLASFTNFSGGATGASAALTKALLGERESVKSLGISILESDVKARVKQMEAMGLLTNMTMRQKKAFATLKIAQEQSKNAIGDYARTSGSFANTLRRLTATAENFGVFMGQTLVPIIQPFVNMLLKIGEFTSRNKEIFQDLLTILVPVIGTIGLIVAAIKTWVVIQKVLNLVMLANPIGLIIIAIVALIGVIVIAWRRSETFRGSMMGLFNVFRWLHAIIKDKIITVFKDMDLSIKGLGETIYNSLIRRFEILLTGIKGIGRAFKLLFEGEFTKAANTAGKAIFNITAGVITGQSANDVLEIAQTVGKVFNTGFKKGMKADGSTILDDMNNLAGGGATSEAGASALSSGVKGTAASVTGAAPKVFNLNIEKLIEQITIKAESVKESTEEISDVVLKAITNALADVQTIVR